MSKLRLRIDKYIEGEGQQAPVALASIYPLDAEAKEAARSQPQRQEIIPISHESSRARTVEVPPGRYRVEVTLPSGEMLSDDVRATDARTEDVILKGSSSPHEWLGWQSLYGNVMPVRRPTQPGPGSTAKGKHAIKVKATAKAREKATAKAKGRVRPRPVARLARRGVNPFTGEGMVFGMRPVKKAIVVPPPAPMEKVDNPIYWLSTPWPELLAESWVQLGERSAHAPAVEELNSGAAARPLLPVASDRERALFRVRHGAGGSGSATSLGSTLKRDFVAVRAGGTLELLSLPVPWTVPGSGREAVVEIIVQRVPRAYEFSSSIAVQDEHLALLLGYLSAGSLGNASALAEHATDLLFGKMENPLAAAAGAYALVGAETDSRPKHWHGWVENLMNGNPHLPDGAIQYAMLRMRGGPSRLSEACTLFKQACGRGLPYYSLGLRWLLDGLERFAPRDAEAAMLARKVRAVSVRMHQQSPFTILRLGSR